MWCDPRTHLKKINMTLKIVVNGFAQTGNSRWSHGLRAAILLVLNYNISRKLQPAVLRKLSEIIAEKKHKMSKVVRMIEKKDRRLGKAWERFSIEKHFQKKKKKCEEQSRIENVSSKEKKLSDYD